MIWLQRFLSTKFLDLPLGLHVPQSKIIFNRVTYSFIRFISPTIFINWSIIIIASNIKWAPRSPVEVCSTKILQHAATLSRYI